MIRWQWRWPRWFLVLVAVVALTNSSVTFGHTADLNIMQAKNATWFASVYVAQLRAHIRYTNGSGYYGAGGTWYWIEKPKVYLDGSYPDCHLDAFAVKQTLVGSGCSISRITRSVVEVSMIWKQEIKVLDFGLERTCSMRAKVRAPDAVVYDRRWGGDC